MRKDFNWSLLTRSNLYSLLYTAGPDLVGKKMEINEFQKYLSNHIKSSLPIKVTRRRNGAEQTRGFPYIGGIYDSDIDEAGSGRAIELVVSYHPKDTAVKITEYRWSRLCAIFADTILHEVIHMRQYRSRNFKCIPGYESTAYYRKQRDDQEYFGHRDEMGAFSFNMASDMVDKFGYNPLAVKHYMDSRQAKRHKKSSFCKFMAAFDWNHNHIKVRQMKLKILKQLEYAAIGKPFKTTNYLTY
jgi:hypothetical protein